ncbi:MAG: ATP-binding protein [Bacteroidetes bacterium]|nr:ATP-binding protein [Bacteroidota bacterium]
MALIKDSSPFYSGRPLPHELFTGRDEQIRLIERSLKQVAVGKQQAVFLTGEFGIGKSSLAHATRYIAESKHDLIGIHVMLGGTKTLDDLSERTLEYALRNEAYKPRNTERVRDMLSKYIGQQSVLGINLNFDQLKADAPTLSRGFLPFLKELYKRAKGDGVKGVYLILDEVNGITPNPDFAHFVKTLVDGNALSADPLPLFLLLCGVRERRDEMVAHHKPVDRIFDIIDVQALSERETNEFYIKTFSSVGYTINERALSLLFFYAQGFPRAINLIGDNIFWKATQRHIDYEVALYGVIAAANEIGAKFIDSQVLKTIESADYKSILRKIIKNTAVNEMAINKKDILPLLSPDENNKFNNFMQKLKKLAVLRSGIEQGEYIFNDRLTRLYLSMKFYSGNL